jgi:nucleoside-diphosphate-sugar epimerase
VFGRILAGKKPQWTGRLDQPHTFHYLPDIARGLLVLADRGEADGQVWHLPAAKPLTAQRFFDLVAQAAGQPVPVRASAASPALLAVAGVFSPLLREMRETTYQFRAPFVIDASKFEAVFGRLEPTPHRDAVQRTVAWYRSRDHRATTANQRQFGCRGRGRSLAPMRTDSPDVHGPRT